MKLLFSALILLTICSVLILPSSCTKTNTKTQTDTLTIKDSVTIRDTVTNPGDTTYKHINDSLWCYFPIDGTIYDSSGHGHTLTLMNGATTSTDTWGNANGALDFNATIDSAYGLIQDGVNFTSTDSFSVSMFIMPRAQSGIVFAKIDYYTGFGASWHMGADPIAYKDSIGFSITTTTTDICTTPGSGNYNIDAPALWIPGNWYHVVGTYYNGTQKLYVNGSIVDSLTTTLQTSVVNCSSAPFIVANWWQGDHRQYFNGKIDEIRIYTRALKANEVTYLFNQYNTLRK
jgi:hypothetical protein